MVEQASAQHHVEDMAVQAVGGDNVAVQAANALRADVLPSLTVSDNKEKVVEAGEKIKEGKGGWDGRMDAKLTRTEHFLANSLTSALSRGDLAGAADAMNAISDNPASAHNVLNNVRNRMERENPKTQVTFQTGTDQDGRSFANMQVRGPFSTTHISPDGAYTEKHNFQTKPLYPKLEK